MLFLSQIIILMRFLLLTILSTCMLFAFSQQATRIDSLNNVLRTSHEINDKIEVYIELCKEHKNSDLNISNEMALQALKLAEQLNSNEYLGEIHLLLAEIAAMKDNMALAQKEYLQAISFLEQTSRNKLLVSAYIGLGNKYIELDNYYEAMDNYLKGIDIAEENNYSKILPSLYNNSGIIYLRMKNYEKSLALFTKAIELFEENNDSSNVAGTTANIGSIYTQMGNLDIAKTYYQRGYEFFRDINNGEGKAHTLLKLGLLDLMQERYDSALKYLMRSLDIQRELEVTLAGSKSIFLAETYINLGIAYLQKDQVEKAIDLLTDGYDMAVQTGQLSLIALSSENLSKAYENENDEKLALEYFKVYKSYSDSLFNEENVRKITQIELQHQFDNKLKERRMEELRQKRRTLIYIIISGGLLFLLIVVILLLQLEKNKKKKVELERKGLKDELDFRNKELATYVLYNLRKSEFIISISEKLKKARLDAKPENKKILGEIISDLKSSSTMDEWKEFEVRFQNVYTGFYKKLSDKFPDLTPNELRLCAFLRLNMSTKDIAAITYQSHNSIDTARFRLRKKLGLSKEDNLITFLSKI